MLSPIHATDVDTIDFRPIDSELAVYKMYQTAYTVYRDDIFLKKNLSKYMHHHSSLLA